ncbi:MAG: YciI family protein [Chloroflexota bacterium]|nr:YciI family protein [Chloroflexota bacterium]
MPQFILLLRGGKEAWQHFSPEETQQMMQAYFDWTDQLRRDGRLQGSAPLQDGGRVLRPSDGRGAVDGPYTETKEAVAGYTLISASDEAEAVELARNCPTLTHGGLVEVREIREVTTTGDSPARV